MIVRNLPSSDKLTDCFDEDTQMYFFLKKLRAITTGLAVRHFNSVVVQQAVYKSLFRLIIAVPKTAAPRRHHTSSSAVSFVERPTNRCLGSYLIDESTMTQTDIRPNSPFILRERLLKAVRPD